MAQESLEQAHQHRMTGEYAPAIELYRQLLEADAKLAEALWGLGLSLMNTGEFDEAATALGQAVEVEPANPRYLLDAGKHYTMLGMYDEAKPYFEKVLEIAPDSALAAEAQKQLSYY